jgi:hypothetical protein
MVDTDRAISRNPMSLSPSSLAFQVPPLERTTGAAAAHQIPWAHPITSRAGAHTPSGVFERLSEAARIVVVLSQEEARLGARAHALM